MVECIAFSMCGSFLYLICKKCKTKTGERIQVCLVDGEYENRLFRRYGYVDGSTDNGKVSGG